MCRLNELVLSTQFKLKTHKEKRFKSLLIQEKLKFLVVKFPEQLDRFIGFLSNYKK